MGYDVSYHPISEEQIELWYWKGLDDLNGAQERALEAGIEEFYVNKYIDTLKVGLKVDLTESFDHTHGYYIAVVQGFFEKFFYTRGGAISFSEKGVLDSYFTPWEKIVTNREINQEIKGRIEDNYCSGVYLSAEAVIRLLEDYNSDIELKNELDELFSHKRINVFLTALKYAKERGVGLLEATEVVEPNPFDLNSSGCYSNLFNCDLEGALLYREEALRQIGEIEEKEDEEKKEIVVEYVKTIIGDENVNSVENKEKKSFWKRLFG